MTARALGSLTGNDLGKSIAIAGTSGTLASVRHYRIDTGADAKSMTSLIVKVPTRNRREPDHREIRGRCTDHVQVTP